MHVICCQTLMHLGSMVFFFPVEHWPSELGPPCSVGGNPQGDTEGEKTGERR